MHDWFEIVLKYMTYQEAARCRRICREIAYMADRLVWKNRINLSFYIPAAEICERHQPDHTLIYIMQSYCGLTLLTIVVKKRFNFGNNGGEYSIKNRVTVAVDNKNFIIAKDNTLLKFKSYYSMISRDYIITDVITLNNYNGSLFRAMKLYELWAYSC